MIAVKIIREYPDYEENEIKFETLEKAKKYIKQVRENFEKENYKITFFEEEFDFTAKDETSEFNYFINI